MVFSYLLHHGRQSLPKIAHKTHLSPRQVRHGLAVLIQQHLIFHFTSLDDGVTYYEADWKNAYAIVRSGKIIQLVDDRLGEYAAKIMSAILYLGHVKVSDLEKMYHLISPVAKAPGKGSKANGVNGIHANRDGVEDDAQLEDAEIQAEPDVEEDFAQANGEDDDDGSAISQLHSALRQLASYGYIFRVRDAHFHSPADNFQSAARQAKASSSVQGLKGKKLEDAIKENAEALVNEWTNGSISGVRINAAPRGVKRRAVTTQSGEPARKRVKLENDIAQYENEEDEIDEDDYGDDVAPMDVSRICTPFEILYVANEKSGQLGGPRQLSKIRRLVPQSQAGGPGRAAYDVGDLTYLRHSSRTDRVQNSSLSKTRGSGTRR